MLLNAESYDGSVTILTGGPAPEIIDEIPALVPDDSLPRLRNDIGEIHPRVAPPHTHVGRATVQLLVDVIKSDENPGGIKDGKEAADGLADSQLVSDFKELEGRIATGYAEGRHPNQIYRDVAGEPVNYENSGSVMVFPPGAPAYEAAIDLRGHQERKVSDGKREYSVRNASDGRFRREDAYPHDARGIGKGLMATGDIDKVIDLLDIQVRDTLRNGHPSNGIIIGKKEGSINYFDSRSQRNSLFYLVRLLGERYGEEVFVHEPYLQAMEMLWEHFNPQFPDDFRQGQAPGQFVAYRRSILTPEGWPLSRWGDDTNNDKPLEEYLPRLEMAKADLLAADEAASRVAPEDRVRVRAQTLVSIQAAAESGRDFDLDRFAGGRGISYIETTNIVPIDLQCELIDAAEVLALSWEIKRRHAEASGNDAGAQYALQKVIYYTDNRAMRIKAINKYGYNPRTGGFNDIKFSNPSAMYDAISTFGSYGQTGVISSANNMAPLISGATSLERSLSAKRIAERELLDRGGLASTNSRHRDHGQWAGDEAWMIDQCEAASASAHAAARWGRRSPAAAEEFLAFGDQVKDGALSAVQARLDEDHVFPEHWNARDPEGDLADSEYVHQPNLAMTAEGVIELVQTDLREKAARLAPVAGRFVIADQPRRISVRGLARVQRQMVQL